MIRVLVVDDSPFFRKAIARILEKDPDIKVIGFASNGKEAIEKVLELSPDVVTLDIEMPIADGFEALEGIMAKKPTPVLVVSALTKEGARETIRALELGALDFVPKNIDKGLFGFYDMEKEIINKVKAIAGKEVLLRISDSKAKASDGDLKISEVSISKKVSVVGIGSSTGGPNALKKVFECLDKKDLPLPVLVAQHMPPLFTAMLAERLNEASSLDVKEAVGGETLENGVVYIAPGGKVMEVENFGSRSIIRIKDPDESVIYRPSVDLLFASVARVYGPETLGIVLTGMGNDGSMGAKEIKNRGGIVVVESEDTAVVYGMPRSVYEKGLADYKVPLFEIPGLIKKIAKGPGGSNR
ncbi:MAG: protein-glutamate methylesterase/protein-glutamine glutaminase [Thermosulfidibacteraceae bacterium]|jgi:two-component system chemotaxis response regulator CheB